MPLEPYSGRRCRRRGRRRDLCVVGGRQSLKHKTEPSTVKHCVSDAVGKSYEGGHVVTAIDVSAGSNLKRPPSFA